MVYSRPFFLLQRRVFLRPPDRPETLHMTLDSCKKKGFILGLEEKDGSILSVIFLEGGSLL